MEPWIQIYDQPAHFILIKSGWKDMFHLIYESPEDGDLYHESHFITERTIRNKFSFAVIELEKLLTKEKNNGN